MFRSNQLIFSSRNRNQLHIKKDKSLLTLGPNLRKILPQNIKTKTPLSRFREYTKVWFARKCKCNVHKPMKIYVGCKSINHTNNAPLSLYFKYFIFSAAIGYLTTIFSLLTW